MGFDSADVDFCAVPGLRKGVLNDKPPQAMSNEYYVSIFLRRQSASG